MPANWSDMDEWERRTLMKTLGPAGLGLIAGCLGDDDGGGGGNEPAPTADVPDLPSDEDDGSEPGDDGPEDGEEELTPIAELVDPRDYVIDGQTLRFGGLWTEPNQAHFAASTGYWYEGELDYANLFMDVVSGYPMRGKMSLGPFANVETEDYSDFYTDDTGFGVETYTVEMHDDVTWSDGEPVTARDAMLPLMSWGGGPSPPGDGFYSSTHHHSEFPDGGLDGRRVEHIALPTWVEEVDGWLSWQPKIRKWWGLGPNSRCGAVNVGTPTHVDPYDRMTDFLWEAEQFKWELLEENPNVWNDPEYMRNFVEEDPEDFSPFDRLWQEEAPEEWISDGGGPYGRSVAQRETIDGPEEAAEIVERSRDPEWLTTLGLYELDEIVGAEGYRLVPNEEHFLYGEHTFDEVFVEWIAEPHREKAGIMAERYDFSQESLKPEELEVRPDLYTLQTAPSNDGFTLTLNHFYWPGDSVWVRQGLKYATDEGDVVQNVDPKTSAPVTIPGLHQWGADEFIDPDWAQDTLIDYSYDRERATELFERAGYEKIEGTWHDADGNPIEENIATDNPAPVAEETIADQWRDFGIAAQTLAMDEATLQERWNGPEDPLLDGANPGDLPIAVNIWPSPRFSGWFPSIGTYIGGATISFTDRIRGRYWYGVEKMEQVIEEHYSPESFYGRSPEIWDNYTVEIPPAGEADQDGSVSFAPASTNERCSRGSFDYTGDNQPIIEGIYEPDELDVNNVYEAHAWFWNWFIPDLPIYRNQTQSHLNNTNYHWGREIPKVEGLRIDVDDIHEQWDDWGVDRGPHYYPGNNLIWGNPAEPRVGAEVRRTDDEQ